MIMWEFWPNFLHVIRCLIEGLKGENQTLENLELNLILTLLEKEWHIRWSYDNSNISWFDFWLSKVRKELNQVNLLCSEQ